MSVVLINWKNRSETILISFQGFRCRAVYKTAAIVIIIDLVVVVRQRGEVVKAPCL